MNFVKIISKNLREIEEFNFNTENKLDAKYLFSQLKSCENLKILEWKIFGKNPQKIDGQDKNMIDVIQRISKLNTQVFIFLRFKFEMNNLTELTLFKWWNDGQLKDFQGNQMKFDNLVKLTLEDLDVEDYFEISKFEFPKLESVVMSDYEWRVQAPATFFNQIKHIKSLSCLIDSDMIYSLESKLFKLIDFECTHINMYNDYDYKQTVLLIVNY